MKLVKCPEVYRGSPNECSLFLGGGITGCPPWRNIVIDGLKDSDLVLIDPVRDNFDVNDKNLEKDQITWEFEHLFISDMKMFWFGEETLCPITLFELGRHIYSQRLFVGCHPNYKRKNDVIIQLGLHRPDLQVRFSLEEIVEDINGQR